jgi:ATP synthase protein I
MKPTRNDEDGSFAREGAQYMGVGLQFAFSIVFFLFVGRWLDARLGTDPWLLLLGVFVGAGAGFYSLYRQLVIVPRERERTRRGE